MEDQPFSRPLPNDHLMEVFAQFPLRQLLIEGGMRLGLADQDKGEPFLDEDLTHGLVRVQVIAQNRDASGPIVGGIFAYPAFGRRIFNLLAFLLHTLLDLQDAKYRVLRRTLGRRQTFFDDLRALMRYWCFASWGELLDFMLDGLEIEIPPDSS